MIAIAKVAVDGQFFEKPLLNLMAMPTEQIALLILAALKEEWEHDQSHLTCRTESEVLGPLKSKHKIEDCDIDRGINFLVSQRLLSAVNRKDGRASFPSELGFNFLALLLAAKKAAGWTLDRRLVLYGIILGLLTLIAGLVTLYIQG